jgi:ankyrin repeat protein
MIQPEAVLLYAAAIGDAGLIEALTEEGVNVNVRDDQGRTPLMLTVLCAARLRGRSIARMRRATKLLMCNGADAAAVDHHGHTAAALAEHFGQAPLVRLLSGQGSLVVEVRPISPRKKALLNWLKVHPQDIPDVAALPCPDGARLN